MHAYGKNAAFHYAAYRPPLHGIVLARALGDRRFGHALDLGCGTGQSSVALAGFAERVTAVDNSRPMLASAQAHPRVSFNAGDETRLPVADRSVDLVALAGVVPYLKLPELGVELRRVCQPETILVPYDFKVELQPLIELFWPADPPASAPYDHAMTLDGLDGVSTRSASQDVVEFALSASEAAHLILANEARFDALRAKTGAEAVLISRVGRKIEESDFQGTLKARLFWAIHCLK